MKLTITNIFREQKIAKSGKPYQSVVIETLEYPGKKIRGFGDKFGKTNTWEIGLVVEADVNTTPEGYMNFENPVAAPKMGLGQQVARVGMAETLKAKEEEKWDKISFGKCKTLFLLEAYKNGLGLEIAEAEAERWAAASMRILAEKDELPIIQEEEFPINEIPF